jgi:hypothetical protein
MGSLIDERQRREAAARAEAEELRGRIAELAERLAGVEERLSRLVITREMVDEVLSEAGAGVPPAAGPEVTAQPGADHSPAAGVLAVPPWRAGLEVSVLPQAYRDLVEVAEDAEAVLTLRAVISNGDFDEYWVPRGPAVPRLHNYPRHPTPDNSKKRTLRFG